MHRKRFSKSADRYTVILLFWGALTYLLVTATRPIASGAFHRSPALGVLEIITLLFISYFWLNGTKDLAYPLAYRLRLARGLHSPPLRHLGGLMPSVGLLYCTCNDFNRDSFLASMQRDLGLPRSLPTLDARANSGVPRRASN